MNQGLQIQALGYRVDSAALLTNVSAQLAAATLTCVVGPNGAGKSTLLRLLAGLLPPSTGIIHFNNLSLNDMALEQRARTVALLAQEHSTDLALTVRELVQLGRLPYTGWSGRLSEEDQTAVTQALQWSGVDVLEGRALQSLSGGERQRAFLALAVAQNTPVILLDEPGTFLDLHWQHDLWARLKTLATQQGKLVLAVTHDLNATLALADTVLVLKEGTLLAQGRPLDVLTHERVEQVYGCQVIRSGGTVAPRWI